MTQPTPINPYATPQVHHWLVTRDDYFGIATKNLSVSEYWRLANNPFEFVIGMVFKFLRVDLPMWFAIAHARFLQILTVDQVPIRAREQMQPLVAEAQALGFESYFWYMIPHLGSYEAFGAGLCSNDGTVFIGIVYARTSSGDVEHELCKVILGSFLQDGRVVSTLNGKVDLDSPPEVLREVVLSRSLAHVQDRHRQRLRDFGSPAMVLRDRADAERIIRQREERYFDFQRERGVFVPLTETQLQRIAATTFSTPSQVSANPKLGWTATMMWIVLGAGLFLIAGGPPANRAEWIMRIGILVLGVAGVAFTWVRSLQRRSKRQNEAAS